MFRNILGSPWKVSLWFVIIFMSMFLFGKALQAAENNNNGYYTKVYVVCRLKNDMEELLSLTLKESNILLNQKATNGLCKFDPKGYTVKLGRIYPIHEFGPGYVAMTECSFFSGNTYYCHLIGSKKALENLKKKVHKFIDGEET